MRLGANYRTYQDAMKPTLVRPTLAEQERMAFERAAEHAADKMSIFPDEAQA